MKNQQGERLIGRDHELAEFERSTGRAAAGECRFVFLSGEPGIGKTCLLERLSATASSAGFLVLSGAGAEFETELPFAPVIDAFDDYLRTLPDRDFERLAAEELTELAAVFPALRPLGPGVDRLEGPDERVLAYYAIRELVERLAARQPLLIVLDDLHWADRASLELLAHLLRRPPQAAVLFAGAFRPAEADPMLVSTVDRACVDGPVSKLKIGPLGVDQAAPLLADAANADQLYLASGGNPFYLLQLARGGFDSNLPGLPEQGEELGVPAAVAAAIQRELEALPAAVRDLAEAAAVAGDSFEVGLAAAAGEIDESVALDLLDDLVARDLVRNTDQPREFRFRHPLVRAAVYQFITPGARLAMHSRCAKRLADRGASPQVLAHHVERSAAPEDGAAIELLREAGDFVAARAPASAAHWHRAALRLAGGGPEYRETKLALLGSLARELASIGELDRSRDALLEALALSPESDRIGLVAACASVENLMGRHTEAHRRLKRALDELPEKGSTARVDLLIALATDAMHRRDFAAYYRWAERAREVAESLDSPVSKALALATNAYAAAVCGDVDAAARLCVPTAELVDGMADDEVVSQLETVTNLAGAELYIDRYEEAARHATRGVRLAKATGQGATVPTLHATLGAARWVLGRLEEAAASLEEGVELARLSGDAQGLAWRLFNLGIPLVLQGRIKPALAASEESVEIASELDEGIVTAWSNAVYGVALFEAGRPEEAEQAMVANAGGEDLSAIAGVWRVWFLERLVKGQLELGKQSSAERGSRIAIELAHSNGLPFARVLAHRAVARVALAGGSADEAVSQGLRSVELADELGARVDAGLSRTVVGEALTELGRGKDAVEQLERAAADFDRCGANRYRDRAEQILRGLGRTVHRRSRRGAANGQGVPALTGRELEVAQLVADHRTNKEIASELFLGLKTVESHMRSIFRKLGVDRRAEVARMVAAHSERAARPR